MKTCRYCGAKNPDTVVECAACGTRFVEQDIGFGCAGCAARFLRVSVVLALVAGIGIFVALWVRGRPSAGIVRTIRGQNVFSLAVAPVRDDGTILFATGGYESEVTIREITAGRTVATVSGKSDGSWTRVLALDFSDDGDYLLGGDETGTITGWNTRTWEETLSVDCRGGTIVGIAVGPKMEDGRRYVAAAHSDSTVGVRPLDGAGKLALTLPHADDVKSVAFSPDGRSIATLCGDDLVWLWDARTGEPIRTMTDDNLRTMVGLSGTVTVSPDGNFVVAGAEDGTLRVWSLVSGRRIRTMPTDGFYLRSATVCISGSGGLYVVAAVDETVEVWNLKAGTRHATLKGHRDAVWGLGVSDPLPDGRQFIVSGDSRGVVHVWRVPWTE